MRKSIVLHNATVAVAHPNLNSNKFIKYPLDYWDDFANQRAFIETATRRLNIKQPSDWYKISHQDLNNLGGRTLLKKYKDSRVALLSSLLPDHEWLPWKFSKSSRNFWDDISNQRSFLNWHGKNKLQIQQMEDWYNVTYKVHLSFASS